MISPSCRRRSGFNAIELVVVILIVFIVIGLILVMLPKPMGPSGRGQTNNNLKQLTLACHSVNDVHKRIPPAFDQYGDMMFPASVHIHLLPYIEQDAFYQMYLNQKGIGEKLTNAVVPPFLAPHDITLKNYEGVQNFAANLRVFSDKGLATRFDANMPELAAIEPGNASIPRSFTDGTSNTIFFTLKYANCQDGGSRYVAAPDSAFAAFFGQNAAKVKSHPSDPTATFQDYPTANQCLTTPLMAQSMSRAGLQLGLGDGSVRMISQNISHRPGTCWYSRMMG